jgi:septal ring factor EnvC (AmiA/AmiB activator)
MLRALCVTLMVCVAFVLMSCSDAMEWKRRYDQLKLANESLLRQYKTTQRQLRLTREKLKRTEVQLQAKIKELKQARGTLRKYQKAADDILHKD